MYWYTFFNPIYQNVFKASHVVKVGAINESILMNIYSRIIALVTRPQCEGGFVTAVDNRCDGNTCSISWRCPCISYSDVALFALFSNGIYIIVTDCLVFFLNVTVIKGLISSTNILQVPTSALQKSKIRKRRSAAFFSFFFFPVFRNT